ncbi:MAG: phage holin family protein [Anaerolineae bacterium]|nr:MAG: phage holin family protein [Anaerolineae bacterium]
MNERIRNPRLRSAVVRILVIWAIQTAALIIMAFLLNGVTIDGLGTAIWGAAIIGLLNALLWPLLSFVLVPFAVLTLGIGALLLNGFMVLLASEFVNGFEVDGFWTAFWVALGMSAINIILSTLLTIDDDNSWYRNQVRRRMKRIATPEPTNVPGVIFLEIDGLAEPILEQALEEGHLPTLKSWIDSGSHVITGWEPDTSSQTSASQAGILHGDNSNIPAFRWYDKTSQRIIASSDLKMLPDIEKQRSNGKGLLSNDGASRGNLFSGDAPYVMATASTIRDKSKFHTSEFQAYFGNPYNASRTILLLIWDMILEWRQFRCARKNNVQPILDKHHRGGIYPVLRGFMTVVMRELSIYTVLGDIFAGRSVVYATFVGYDEIAHHSGVLDPGAFDILYKLDQQFRRLTTAVPEAPRPYHFVILSDHGQTGGATFKQRYGKSLQEYVQELMETEGAVVGEVASGEDWGHLSAYITDTIRNEDSASSKVAARAFKSRTKDGRVWMGPEAADVAEIDREAEEEQLPEVVALASGNLGLISFTRWPGRMSQEQIDQAFPAVLPGLREHELVGFVMVRSEKHGPVVYGNRGTYYLQDDRVEGTNPLEVFGPNAASHLRRTDSFPNCPDIVVNSFCDPETDEGAAFEELIGFYGGLGGMQTKPFILHPAELEASGEMVGTASVYWVCKGWLDELHGPTPSRQAIESPQVAETH